MLLVLCTLLHPQTINIDNFPIVFFGVCLFVYLFVCCGGFGPLPLLAVVGPQLIWALPLLAVVVEGLELQVKKCFLFK